MTLDFVLVRGFHDTPPWMPRTNDTELLELIRAQYGFDDPLIEQYGHFVLNFLTLDLGFSIGAVKGAVVGELIGDALATTCILFAAVLILSLTLGAFGEALIRSLRRRTSRGLMRIVALALVSTPMVGLVLLLVHVDAWAGNPLPVWNHNSTDDNALAAIGRSAFPVLIAVLACFGLISAMTKGNEQMESKTSLVKETKGVILEVLRNHWLSRFFFAWVLTATLGIEVVFWYSGLGGLLFDAIRLRDGPLFMALFYVLALMLVLLSFAIDAASALMGRREPEGETPLESEPRPKTGVIRPREARVRIPAFLKGLWADYRMSRSGSVALGVIGFFIAVALLAPVISTVRNPMEFTNNEPNDAVLQWFNPHPPSLHRSPLTGDLHPFGTDLQGGDIWSLTWYGARAPVLAGAIVFASSLTIGLAAGITGVALGSVRGRSIKALSWFAETVAEAFIAIPVILIAGSHIWNPIDLWSLALPATFGFYGWGWLYVAREAKRNSVQPVGGAIGLRSQVKASLLPITRSSLFVAKFAVPAVLIAIFAVEMLGSYSGSWESWGKMVDTYFSWNVFCSCRTWYQLLFPVLAIAGLTTSAFVAIDTLERVTHMREKGRVIPTAEETLKVS